MSEMFYKNYDGDLFAGFNYRALNASTGVASNQSYHSSVQSNLFSKDHYTAGLEIEAGKKFYGVVRIGGMGYLANDEAAAGVGYNLFFYHKKRFRKNSYGVDYKNPKMFLLKFSVCLAENQFNQHLNCIDNTNQNIYALGVYEPYTTTYKNTTYYANRINVDYNQTVYSVVPQISFGNNPFKSRFHFQVDVGWLLPFAQKGGLLFDQCYTHGNGDAGVQNDGVLYPTYYNAQTKGLTLQYNDKPITKTPFNLGGLMVKVGIGINIAPFFK